MSIIFQRKISKLFSKKWWIFHLSSALGIQLERRDLIIISIIVIVVFIQAVVCLSLNSPTIFCKIPNLRAFHHACKHPPSFEKLPIIYVITPTYERPVQKAELTRLSHTLMLVPNLHWIIVEDSDWSTDMITKFVRRLRNEFDFQSLTQLKSLTPRNYKLAAHEPYWSKPKGVWQRNRALTWLRENLDDLDPAGVIYFADDDNTYDLELFNEMRYTEKVSVWPVGLVGGLLVETPIAKSGKVESFNSMWRRDRPFPIDMAGFAVSIKLFSRHQNVTFSAEKQIGFVESHFLNQLVKSVNELEPKANNCSRILVWHTRTQNPVLHEERKLTKPSHSDMNE